jgi:hypothetical protein
VKGLVVALEGEGDMRREGGRGARRDSQKQENPHEAGFLR